ncbi:MAG: hypothetical protein KAU36_09665 [candidate division Zixibacteria bacterium]|nr:hypothetical protein [candidate division Zixibacteria bacterium]
MSRNKWVIGALFVLLVVGIFISCSDDIILEPLPSLLGDYEGRYSVTTNYLQPNQKTKTSDITWRFSDLYYWMTADTSGAAFCSPSGTYTLEVLLVQDSLNNGCAGVVADEADNPQGVFSLRQPGDSVILTQQEETTYKEILLVRVTR